MPYWPVSARWDDEIRRSQEPVIVAEVWKGTERQTLPDGSTALRVDGGTVTVDEAAKVRRTVSLTLANPDLIPVAPTDLLAGVAVDLRVYRGLRYIEGYTEIIPLGVFRASSPGQGAWLAGLSIKGDDYSKVLQDARFLTPWATPASTPIGQEIARMARDVLGSGLTVVDLSPLTRVTTAATFERDRWDSMEKLAASMGCEVFFDQAGRMVIRPVPEVTSSSTSVWTVDAGNEEAVMTDVATGFDSSRLYNAVTASSSAFGTVVSATAFLDDGPFAWAPGSFERPRFFASPMLTTFEQCLGAARSILARSIAYGRQIRPQSVPNPALDVGDIITVTLPADFNGRVVTEQRVVTKLGFPLDPSGVMSIETRVEAVSDFTADSGSLS